MDEWLWDQVQLGTFNLNRLGDFTYNTSALFYRFFSMFFDNVASLLLVDR